MISAVLSLLSSPVGIVLGETVKRRMRGEVLTRLERAAVKDDSKGLIQSGTFHGVLVVFLGHAASQGWLGIDPAAVPELATQIAVIAGAIWAIWRRIKASKSIG